MKLYHHNTIIALHMHFIYYWSCCSDYLITCQYFLHFNWELGKTATFKTYYIAKYRSSALYCSSTFSPHTKSIPILQIRKVKHKKIMILSSNRRAHKWQNWDLTKFFLSQDPNFLTTLKYQFWVRLLGMRVRSATVQLAN